MVAILCVTVSLLAFVGTFTLMGAWTGAAGFPANGLSGKGLVRAAQRLLATLSHTPLTLWLARQDSWVQVGKALVKDVGASRIRLSVPEAISALWLAGGVLCLLAGLLASSLLAAMLAGVVFCLAIRLKAARLHQAARQQMACQMPDVLRSLSTSLSTNHSLAQSLEYVGLKQEGALSRQFLRTAMEMRCGKPMEEALNSLSRRLEVPGIQMMVCALSIAQRTGSPLKDLFSESARLIDQRQVLEQQLRIKTAQVKLSVKIVCALPAVLLALLSLISPDFRKGVSTPVGMGCIVVAVCLDLLALFIIGKILKGVDLG